MIRSDYDHIVVGAGASGMTAALLLAMNGRRVLLLERGPQIGGSLLRFRRGGVPYDTGFHFTGGLHEGGQLHEMLEVLGLRDGIQPRFLSPDHAHQFYFEAEDRRFDLPMGIAPLRARLKELFPGAGTAVDDYFARLERISAGTIFDVRRTAFSPEVIEEDFITLQEALDGLTGDPLLKGILSGFCMCYGTAPREVSFANHCRMTAGLYQSVAQIAGGGDALVAAFRQRLVEFGVEVRTGATLARCLDVKNRVAGRFLLSDGAEVTAASGVLTIHPRDILDLLPPEQVSKAFASRVRAFEPAAGFFSIFGTVDNGGPDSEFGGSILSLFPSADMNALLDPARQNDSALVIMRSRETVAGRERRVLTAFEPCFPARVAAWRESRHGARPDGYAAYKQEHAGRLAERIVRHLPGYRGRLTLADSASMLTFRDYLHSPDGSAYGIKQLVGQFNLNGKLPVFNLYAAGQSALLPGLVGAMMSSFLVCRTMLGKDLFNYFVGKQLCR